MVHTVVDRDLLKIERAYPLQARDIDTVLLRIRAALVMRIDAAARTETMPCRVGVELVNGEEFASLSNVDAVQVRRHRNRAAHATVRARTTPRRTQPVSQLYSELHPAA